jgi:hypothetical protein
MLRLHNYSEDLDISISWFRVIRALRWCHIDGRIILKWIFTKRYGET